MALVDFTPLASAVEDLFLPDECQVLGPSGGDATATLDDDGNLVPSPRPVLWEGACGVYPLTSKADALQALVAAQVPQTTVTDYRGLLPLTATNLPVGSILRVTASNRTAGQIIDPTLVGTEFTITDEPGRTSYPVIRIVSLRRRTPGTH